MVLLRQENTYDQKFYIYIYKFPKIISVDCLPVNLPFVIFWVDIKPAGTAGRCQSIPVAEALLAEFNYGDPRTAHPMHFQPMPNGTKPLPPQRTGASRQTERIIQRGMQTSFS